MECIVTIPQWLEGAPAGSILIHIDAAVRGSIDSGPFYANPGNQAAVVTLVERVLASVEERPVSFVATRVVRIVALNLALALMFLWYLLVARPPLAEAVLIAVIALLAVGLAGAQVIARIPRDSWGLPPGPVTVTGTPREVMDQRRHDARRDRRIIAWTLGLGIPLSGIGGSILTILATR